MAGTIVLAGIFLAVIVGLWLTRNAKGPRPGEVRQRARESLARYDAMGERIGRPEDELEPPD
jgi:hypothetical protein